MAPKILFDITFLEKCADAQALTGIDQVNLDYALHFARSGSAGVHYRYALNKPHFAPPAYLLNLAERVEARWRKEQTAQVETFLGRFRRWLATGETFEPPTKGNSRFALPRAAMAMEWRKVNPWSFPRFDASQLKAPIYVNVSQHAMGVELYFRWLQRFPDVRAAFFLHDLLPLDHPEFWPAGHKAAFAHRLENMALFADGFMTSTENVKSRLKIELDKRRRGNVPIFASPLPPALAAGAPAASAADLVATPYFVIVGTIEPRKNHSLLLNVWRELAATTPPPVPKLVVVGRRGWETEQVVDTLERSLQLRQHVMEASWAPAGALRELIRNARGLLMPSFSEGFGLPMVEALTLGAPVLAADTPVARESTQGRALYRHLLDGLGWREAILDLADPKSALAQRARAEAQAFVPMSHASYFAGVEAFLSELTRRREAGR